MSPQFFLEKTKYPKACMAWGAIALSFKSDLNFFDSTVNSEIYVEMFIQMYFFQKVQAHFNGTQFYFQQDGATCHTKAESLQFLMERCELVTGWPSNSPDLSQIEMIWAIIKLRISNYPPEKRPKNAKELRNSVNYEWNQIDIDTVNRLVLSFRKRLLLCVQVGGKSISHFLKNRKYEIPKEFQVTKEEEKPYVFSEEIDNMIINSNNLSCKEITALFNIRADMVKYRSKYLQHKKLNNETTKRLLIVINNQNYIRGINFTIPQVTIPIVQSDYNNQINDFEEFETYERFPPEYNDYESDDIDD